MISLLSRFFIKNRDDVTNPKVRKAYGSLCSIVGICLNVILFAGKYFAGAVSGSIAIMADSFNNLSDAGSSVITLVGFALAGQKPHPDHPFGHGRIEYITGLVVSAIIIVMGFELGKSSVAKIITPQEVQTGLLPALILVASICVKVYMSIYNRKIGKKISSTAMSATAMDSLTDSIATAVVLLSMIITHFTSVNIDGYAGLLVAAFIIYAGCGAAKDTLQPLLGQPPEPEFVRRISDIVTAHPEIKGIHDLVVHDYGPGRLMITLHAEVNGEDDFFRTHDVIDNIERELQTTLGCHATIHMDPIESDNQAVMSMRRELADKVREIDGSITIHDFRMVVGPTHTNLIFDAVVPQDFRISDEELIKIIKDIVSENFPNCFAVVSIDKSFVG